MGKFIIQGGKPLKGSVYLSGAKNSGFKLLIASLLADSPSEIIGYSRIGDIEVTQEIIELLGGRVEKNQKRLKAFPKNLASFTVPVRMGEISRASNFFVAPLLYRFGRAIFPVPGGDRIGPRPIQWHLKGLKALGAGIEEKKGLYEVRAPNGLRGGRFRFPKNTHTGTETILMAAVFAQGKTILENAAEEPEVDDMIVFLNKMGAQIKRTAKRKIEIKGVTSFRGAKHQVMPDRNEAVTFGIAALATKGDILVKGANPSVLQAFLEEVKKAGGNFQVSREGIRFWRKGKLDATKVKTSPYPGFMTDWQPLWATLMTQAEGRSEVVETIHNFRFGYAKTLGLMGAKITPFNPEVEDPEKFYNFPIKHNREKYYHGVKIDGPTALKGAKIRVPDIRAGATLTLAALIAQGESILSGIEHIDRGYEDLDGRLKQLGAEIKRVR